MDRAQLEATLADAYVWGYPTVDMHHVMTEQVLDPTSPEFKAPFNQFGHARTVATPSDHAIVSPNVDTPYSYLWIDLRAEPIVVSVPASDEGRYVALELFDLYTYIVGYVSPRTNGNAGGDVLIAGPSWEGTVPDGIKHTFRVPTQIAFALCRTQMLNASDLQNVHRIQDGYRARPLSEYMGTPAPPAPRPLPPITAVDVRKDAQSLRFFFVLGAMMEYMPPLDDEAELRDGFVSAGVSAGMTFPETGEVADAARAAMVSGQAKMFARAKAVRSSAEIFGSREYLGHDYLSRAVGALLGIFGNAQEEYLGVGWQADAKGDGFNGANRYEIQFEAGQMPPVAAFWSITIYTAEKFLYANELGRYVINSAMLPSLAKDGNGGVTLYVQHDRPSEDKVANWLPAPEGDFGLTLRCYQPKRSIIDGKWVAPAVVPVA